MKSNMKGAPGTYIDDFSVDLCDISQLLSEIGNRFYEFINTFEFYRSYLIKCILDKPDHCGYTEGELLRFSIGILENIFVLNHCHDVDYHNFVRYNAEHSDDPEGGAADEK